MNVAKYEDVGDEPTTAFTALALTAMALAMIVGVGGVAIGVLGLLKGSSLAQTALTEVREAAHAESATVRAEGSLAGCEEVLGDCLATCQPGYEACLCWAPEEP